LEPVYSTGRADGGALDAWAVSWYGFRGGVSGVTALDGDLSGRWPRVESLVRGFCTNPLDRCKLYLGSAEEAMKRILVVGEVDARRFRRLRRKDGLEAHACMHNDCRLVD